MVCALLVNEAHINIWKKLSSGAEYSYLAASPHLDVVEDAVTHWAKMMAQTPLYLSVTYIQELKTITQPLVE